jgi:hypothetical protein
MTRPRPTRAGFLLYLREAGHDVASLDAVAFGVKWRAFIRSLEEV